MKLIKEIIAWVFIVPVFLVTMTLYITLEVFSGWTFVFCDKAGKMIDKYIHHD